jgi:predicted double-glycine peptidase
MQLNSISSPVTPPASAPVQRNRMQSFMFELQQKLQQSPELSARLQNLPEGKGFAEAIGRLANSEANGDDVKAIQRFLVQLPGVKLTARASDEPVDGQFGPRSQNALNSFFDKQFSDPGLSSLATKLSGPQTPRDNTRGVTPRPRADFAPVQNFGQPGNTDGQAVQSSIQIDQASFHPQYDSNIKAARDSDCGPASVAMVLESQGYKDMNSGDVREDLMDVSHTGATTSEEVAKGIREGSNGELTAEIITGNSSYKNDPQGFLNKMREELAEGKQVVLLTKNLGSMEKGRSAERTNGHYVVIQGITADNQLILADPGSRGEGLNRRISADTFLAAYAARNDEGMPNNMIVIDKK